MVFTWFGNSKPGNEGGCECATPFIFRIYFNSSNRKEVSFMMKGRYLDDSNYFVGILPNGKKKFYAIEEDYKEEYKEYMKLREEMKNAKETTN